MNILLKDFTTESRESKGKFNTTSEVSQIMVKGIEIWHLLSRNKNEGIK